MKQKINRLSILFFLILCISVCVIPVQAQVVWLTGQTFEFGRLDLTDKVATTFTFRNGGAQPLIIDNVRTSCGCTAPEWDTKPVLPNENGEIRIEFRPNKKGIVVKRIKVWFKGMRKPEILRISANVI